MTIYDRAAATALRLLTKYGQTVTLRRITTGDYDPSTGSASQTTTDYTASAAKFDFDFRMSGMTFVPGTLIQSGDKQIFMSAHSLGITPAPGDQVIIGVDTWPVMGVKELKPADTAVLYEILGRK